MERVIHLDILTPFGKYLSADVEYIKVNSTESVLGILPNHSPLITKLETCVMIIKENGKNNLYSIGGGIMHIKEKSRVVLLLDSIENKDEIDKDRAMNAKIRAENRLLAKDTTIDVTRAQAALKRALNRLSIAEDK